jgi:hypothetical protein
MVVPLGSVTILPDDTAGRAGETLWGATEFFVTVEDNDVVYADPAAEDGADLARRIAENGPVPRRRFGEVKYFLGPQQGAGRSAWS